MIKNMNLQLNTFNIEFINRSLFHFIVFVQFSFPFLFLRFDQNITLECRNIILKLFDKIVLYQ